MSLSTWSYSNYADMKPMDSTAPTVARKKVTKATKFVPPPPATSDDEASLADFHAEPSDEEDERAPTRTEMAFLKKAPPALSYEKPFEVPATAGDANEKLDYVIQLLEQQKDEPTGHGIEEIVLYLFIGVFVIFVLDSFVKTGKYSR